jgi:hypothetical protein
MALKTMIEKLNAQRTAYEDTLKAASKGGGEGVGAFLGALIPPGHALEWTQGTPSFNDGDACKFSVHEPNLIKFGEPFESEDYDDDTLDDEDGEERALATVIREYGKPDRMESYQRDNYSRPLGAGKYVQETVSYKVKGFPAIEGTTVEDLTALEAAFDSIPKDLMDAVFKGDAKVRVYSGGRVSRSDYYME